MWIQQQIHETVKLDCNRKSQQNIYYSKDGHWAVRLKQKHWQNASPETRFDNSGLLKKVNTITITEKKNVRNFTVWVTKLLVFHSDIEICKPRLFQILPKYRSTFVWQNLVYLHFFPQMINQLTGLLSFNWLKWLLMVEILPVLRNWNGIDSRIYYTPINAHFQLQVYIFLK